MAPASIFCCAALLHRKLLLAQSRCSEKRPVRQSRKRKLSSWLASSALLDDSLLTTFDFQRDSGERKGKAAPNTSCAHLFLFVLARL
jgi:hypothetical protein